LLLAMLALAVPPAYAISDEALNSLTASASPAAISVSTSLDSCGIIDDGVVCKLDVSFNSIPNADSYSATVTRADGSVIDYGTVSPGGTSLWVPYVGAGNYSVKITAYGEPDTPTEVKHGHGDVIATGYSPNVHRDRDRDDGDQNGNGDKPEEGNVETGVIGRDPEGGQSPSADGAPTTDVGSAPTESTTTTECTTPTEPAEPPTPPEEPPADTDPDNPDEDADGIPDEQEQAIYDQQMAEYQAAIQTQAAADASGC
jgi:hypothetical protein